MTRDELILVALASGETSTAALVELTDLPERTCRRGLQRLVRDNYAWRPMRGMCSLTRRGREIASELIEADGD